jgi:hypothetical protein
MAWLSVVPPMLLSRRIGVQPIGGVIVATDEMRTETAATITSPTTASGGRTIVSEDDFEDVAAFELDLAPTVSVAGVPPSIPVSTKNAPAAGEARTNKATSATRGTTSRRETSLRRRGRLPGMAG